MRSTRVNLCSCRHVDGPNRTTNQLKEFEQQDFIRGLR